MIQMMSNIRTLFFYLIEKQVQYILAVIAQVVSCVSLEYFDLEEIKKAITYLRQLVKLKNLMDC